LVNSDESVVTVVSDGVVSKGRNSSDSLVGGSWGSSNDGGDWGSLVGVSLGDLVNSDGLDGWDGGGSSGGVDYWGVVSTVVGTVVDSVVDSVVTGIWVSNTLVGIGGLLSDGVGEVTSDALRADNSGVESGDGGVLDGVGADSGQESNENCGGLHVD